MSKKGTPDRYRDSEGGAKTLHPSPYITRISTRNGMASSATWYSAVTIPLFIEVSYGKVQETTR